MALRILRRRARTLLAVAFIFQVPGALLTSAASLRFSDVVVSVLPIAADGTISGTILLSDEDLARLLDAGALVVIAAALTGILSSIATLAFATVVGADLLGRPVGAREASAGAIRRVFVVLGIVLLTTAATLLVLVASGALVALALVGLPSGDPTGGGPGAFLSIVVIVGAVFAVAWLSLRWAVALPAAALEPAGVRASLRRSWRLTAGNMLRTLGVLVAAAVTTAVLSGLVAQVLGVLLVDPLANGGTATLMEVLTGALATILLAPVAPVLVAVLYHDLRMRADGRPVAAPAAPYRGGRPPA